MVNIYFALLEHLWCLGDSFFKDRHGLFESLVVRGGNILSLHSHIARIYKGMDSMRIEYPFAQETASEVIIKLCEFAGHKDGMVKIWI